MPKQANPCPICRLANVTDNGPAPHDQVHGYECRRCGSYVISPTAVRVLESLREPERARISVACRTADAAGTPIKLTLYEIEEISKREPTRIPLFEGLDGLLMYLADRVPSHFAKFSIDTAVDHTLLGYVTERGMKDALEAARRLAYLNERADEVTLEGWKRIEELRRTRSTSRKAFVALWFGDEMEPVWRDGFEPGIRDTQYFEPVRMLDIDHAGKIDDRIVAEIRSSGLLVADFTGQRGGVYFEAGFALGLGIPVIWTCRKDQIDQVHFDTRQYNHLLWDNPADLRARLRDRILAVVPAATGSGSFARH